MNISGLSALTLIIFPYLLHAHQNPQDFSRLELLGNLQSVVRGVSREPSIFKYWFLASKAGGEFLVSKHKTNSETQSSVAELYELGQLDTPELRASYFQFLKSLLKEGDERSRETDLKLVNTLIHLVADEDNADLAKIYYQLLDQVFSEKYYAELLGHEFLRTFKEEKTLLITLDLAIMAKGLSLETFFEIARKAANSSDARLRSSAVNAFIHFLRISENLNPPNYSNRDLANIFFRQLSRDTESSRVVRLAIEAILKRQTFSLTKVDMGKPGKFTLVAGVFEESGVILYRRHGLADPFSLWSGNLFERKFRKSTDNFTNFVLSIALYLKSDPFLRLWAVSTFAILEPTKSWESAFTFFRETISRPPGPEVLEELLKRGLQACLVSQRTELQTASLKRTIEKAKKIDLTILDKLLKMVVQYDKDRCESALNFD